MLADPWGTSSYRDAPSLQMLKCVPCRRGCGAGRWTVTSRWCITMGVTEPRGRALQLQWARFLTRWRRYGACAGGFGREGS